jgi:hypothetical protein
MYTPTDATCSIRKKVCVGGGGCGKGWLGVVAAFARTADPLSLVAIFTPLDSVDTVAARGAGAAPLTSVGTLHVREGGVEGGLM